MYMGVVRLDIGFWHLGFDWDLGFGHWDFPLMADTSFVQTLRDNGFTVPDDLRPPQVLLHFGEAVGDDLLCTTVLRELRRRGQQGIWMMTRFPDLFAGNPDVDTLVPLNRQLVELLIQQFGTRFVMPVYTVHDWKNDAGDPVPPAHILAVMCHRAGIVGPVALRPYLQLRPEETAYGQFSPKQIAIHSTGIGATFPMQNKEWMPKRFQEIVDALKGEYTFVQLGSAKDPLLDGAIDLRGQTTIRQSAAVLSHSLLFVGLVGFLMHLARTVNCRSVIIYGGRELPRQSGYSCNENIANVLSCSPCWRWNTCGYDHACMTQIQSDVVVQAIRRQLEKVGQPIADDICTIDVPTTIPSPLPGTPGKGLG
jgi:Glycosyltransferase family 9 (heptosyltransferase)